MFDLPESFVIDGDEYPIETSWRVWAKVEELLTGRNAEDSEQSAKALGEVLLLVFKGSRLPKLKDAFREIMHFYRRGKTEKKCKGSSEAAFDLKYDFGLVNAAFMGQYGINLRQSEMHWWEFWELFEGLKKDEKIIKVIGYRSCNLNDIKNKEEKKHIREMKKLYQLPARKRRVTSEEMGLEIDRLM